MGIKTHICNSLARQTERGWPSPRRNGGIMERYVIRNDQGQFLTPTDGMEYAWGALQSACIYRNKKLAQSIASEQNGELVKI